MGPLSAMGLQLGGKLIGNLMGIGTGGVERRWQQQAMNQQFQFQNQLMQKQTDLNRETWKTQFDLTNRYNSPVEAMKRLEAAGLNVNMMYGKGGLVNASTMGAGSGTGLGTSSAMAPNIGTGPQIDVMGDILKYQEAKRAPIKDAIERYRAANEFEDALTKKYANTETKMYMQYLNGSQMIIGTDPEGHKLYIKEIFTSGNMEGKPIGDINKQDGFARQKLLNLKKSELEYDLNQIGLAMEKLNYSLKELGINPSNNDTMINLAMKLKKDFNLKDDQIRTILLTYNISGEVAKNILKQLNIGKVSIGGKGIKNEGYQNKSIQPKNRFDGNIGPHNGPNWRSERGY